MKTGFIGAGKVGKALGFYFDRYGIELSGYFSKTFKSSADAAELTRSRAFSSMPELINSSDIIFLTVPDQALEEIDAKAAEQINKNEKRCFIHVSGALTSYCLNSLKALGCPVGSMHPLQSFGSPEKSARMLDGTIFSIEGTSEAIQAIKGIMEKTKGKYSLISADQKPLYHAGACIVSNYLVTLLDSGIKYFEAAGIERETVFQAIRPLIDSTLFNIQEKDTVNALTGPIVRGDCNTLDVHLQSIKNDLPSELEFYRQMAEKTIEMISEKRITEKQKNKLLKSLEVL